MTNKEEIQKEIKESEKMIDLLGIVVGVTRDKLIAHNHLDTYNNMIKLIKDEFDKIKELKKQL